MFRKIADIGLDVGSKKIKLARVGKRGDKLEVLNFGSMDTPPGLVEAGTIYDPEALGQAMRPLVNELNMSGKQVISAISGQQIYTRNIVMPRMKLKDLKKAIEFQASNFLPIPVEEAALDIFPVREFEDQEGKKTEVFFVAVRQIQVENLISACRMAGLQLVAVEIEPLAINRVIGAGDITEKRAFLNIGGTRSYFTVFKDEMMVFYRSLSFGCSSFHPGIGLDPGDECAGLETVQIENNPQYDFLMRDIMAEVSRSAEYYAMQSDEPTPDSVDKILLCGGGSRINGFDRILSEGLGKIVQLADPTTRLILPGEISNIHAQDIKHDFLVVLGLAARELI